MNPRRAGIAVLLTLALVAGCTATRSARETQPTAHGHTGAATLLAAEQRSHRVRTVRLVERLIAEVRLPTGARPRSSAPARELRGPDQTYGASNLVSRHAWWTVGESVHAVLRYVRRHAPRGCRFDGSGSSSGPNQRTVYDVMCDGRSTSYAFEPELDVQAVRTTHGSAVRADAQAVWFPHRPAWSYVRHPDSATIVVERHSTAPGARRLPTVRRTVDARAASRLARVLDRQSVYPPVVQSCPADFPGVEDRIAFGTPTGRVRVTVGLTGCPGIGVARAHHRSTELLGAGSVDTSVLHVLHLPKRYAY